MKPQTIDITKNTDVELKAMAYELLNTIGFYQKNLQVVEGELAKRKANEQVQTQEVEVKEEPITENNEPTE